MIAFLLKNGKREVKSAPVAQFGFDPDAPSVTFDRLFADGQPDSGARVFSPIVKPLKDQEDAVCELGLHAYAIVPQREQPFIALATDSQMDLGRLIILTEFDRVGD